MPIYRIDKVLLFCQASNCLRSTFRKWTRSTIIIVPLFRTTYSPYIPVNPIKTVIIPPVINGVRK